VILWGEIRYLSLLGLKRLKRKVLTGLKGERKCQPDRIVDSAWLLINNLLNLLHHHCGTVCSYSKLQKVTSLFCQCSLNITLISMYLLLQDHTVVRPFEYNHTGNPGELQYT